MSRHLHLDAELMFPLWFTLCPRSPPWQDCADAGWWMGEIGGRQGVFPDNFVKLLEVEKEVSGGTQSSSVYCEMISER